MQMFNFVQKTQANLSASSPESTGLRVVGDRASGKTTYMAALSYWPNAKASSPIQAVNPIGDESRELVYMAENILKQGLELAPTGASQISALQQSSVSVIADYSIQLTLKKQFSGGLTNIIVNCKDYAGEFFCDLLQTPNDPILRKYMNDCKEAESILLMIDGTAYSKDSEYANSLDRFLVALDQSGDPKKRRIAFAISKCEQLELWVNRHRPRFIAEARFEKVCKRLQAWEKMKSGKVDYFAVSAFGTVGNDFPEPNAIRLTRTEGGTTSILKYPDNWRPFGLVSPLYWLCTGRRYKQLDED